MTRPTLLHAPAAIYDGGHPNIGRFDGPIGLVNLGGKGLERFRLKEWHYTSVTTERHFAAVALVQLGYAANLFAYVVDRRRPQRPAMTEMVIPLGRGLSFANSSTAGETRFERGRDRVRASHRPDGFTLTVDLGLGDRRLAGSFECVNGASASIVHRLPHGGLAYTHKGTLYDVRGDLRFDGETLLGGSEAFATIDWTRSQASRETNWKWASFAGRDVAGRKVGLNLSAEVYDDPNGDSVENFFYTEAGPEILGGVVFEVPRAPRHMPWRICSREGDDVELLFEPQGARAQDVRLGVVESRFVQPYGTYHGRVRDHEVRGVFGVVEDHHAVW